MDEKIFIEAAKKVSLYKKSDKKNWNYHDTFTNVSKNKEVDLDNHYLYNEWCSGGISGGSCWDGQDGREANYCATEGEKEPDFSEIDAILLELCPNLSFLQYKKITSKIIEQGSRTENEYYGNSSTYSYKFIQLRKLFNTLNEMGL